MGMTVVELADALWLKFEADERENDEILVIDTNVRTYKITGVEFVDGTPAVLIERDI